MSSEVSLKNLLDFTEALKDSPNFRYKIHSNERHFDKIQKRLDETLRLIDIVTDHGQNYVTAFYNLTATLNALWTDMNIEDQDSVRAYKLMSEALSQIVYLNKSLIECSFPSFRVGLEILLKKDLAKLNDTRTHFENLSATLSDALAKKAAINKNKIQELQDAKNSLTAVGTCFAHNSLDYVALLNILHARKSQVFVESLWTLVKEYLTFFRKGHLFFSNKSEICCDDIIESIEVIKSQVKMVERKMQDRHDAVPKEVFQHPNGLPTNPHVVLEGYLFKRSSNAFKTWNRRWFMIHEEKLLYSHKSSGGEVPTAMEENLRLCLVRPAPPSVERTCCFELVTPSRNHLLQADSETLCSAWIRALQRTIQYLHEDDRSYSASRTFFDNVNKNSLITDNYWDVQNLAKTMPSNVLAFHECESSDIGGNAQISFKQPVLNSNDLSEYLTNSDPSEKLLDNCLKNETKLSSHRTEMLKFLSNLLKISGNDHCADCGDFSPRWASINLGIIICIECSGAHRSLGVGRSKVRSLTMDYLDTEQRDILLQLGNSKVNSIFLASTLENYNLSNTPFLDKNSSREFREKWIVAKYVEKKFAVDARYRDNVACLSNSSGPVGDDMANYGITHYNSYFSRQKFDLCTTNNDDNSLIEKCAPHSGDYDVEQKNHEHCTNSLNLQNISNAIKEGCLETILRHMVHHNFELNSEIFSTFPLHLAIQNVIFFMGYDKIDFHIIIKEYGSQSYFAKKK